MLLTELPEGGTVPGKSEKKIRLLRLLRFRLTVTVSIMFVTE